jgi:hypothetical protein
VLPQDKGPSQASDGHSPCETLLVELFSSFVNLLSARWNAGSMPRAVVYAPYGQPYRLD